MLLPGRPPHLNLTQHVPPWQEEVSLAGRARAGAGGAGQGGAEGKVSCFSVQGTSEPACV